jgi:hypothetical protein
VRIRWIGLGSDYPCATKYLPFGALACRDCGKIVGAR